MKNKLLQVLSRLSVPVKPKKNMNDVLNVLATRPSQQRALPKFLRRSDRSGLRNPNYR